MELRYGIIDENVLKRSVEDVILHEGQAAAGRRKDARKAGIDADTDAGRGSAGPEYPDDMPDKHGTGRTLPSVAAVTLGAGYEGGLAVIRAVNGLAADGIRAKLFRPVILLPPGTREETLRDLMRQICRTAFSLNLEVAAGQVEVTDAVTRPLVTGCASGEPFACRKRTSCGRPEKSGPETGLAADLQDKNFLKDKKFLKYKNAVSENAAKDQAGLQPEKTDIVAAGWVGLEGTWLLTAGRMEELLHRFPYSLLHRTEQLREDLCVVRAAGIAWEHGARAMVSPADGGLMAGLWELAKKTGSGLEADLQRMPVLQETIEITDHFEINPYLMKSAGCLLIAAEDGEGLVRRLLEAGINAVRIGRLLSDNKKIIYNGEEIRHLDRPQTDSLAAFWKEGV